MATKIDSSDVQLTIAGQEIGYIQSYDVQVGVFAQPATFTITCGWGQSAGKLIQNVTPYLPFKLRVGEKPCFSGRIGKISVREGEGTEVVISGKDNLGDLFRYKVDRDLKFTKTTYVGLLRDVLTQIGVSPQIILGDAASIANKRAGAPVRRYGIVLNPVTDEFEIKESISSINSSVVARLGDTFYTFLKTYFDRASLFLWSGTDGEFILSRPNTKQESIYQIVRNRDQNSLANRVNAKLVEYTQDIEDRHSQIRINARVGSAKSGRTTFIGSVTDEEILSYGLKNFRSVRDKNSNNPKQADDMAKRILAEERRKGTRLIYVVAGHRTKSLKGGEVIYTPDTMINVKDEELNIDEPWYIEDCRYQRNGNSGTTTQLTLVKPKYMVFLWVNSQI